MESLSETKWDVVISGTGLQQSLLALALSRSDKKILHVDPNEYYGAAEAAFSLQEAAEWAARHSSADDGVFTDAQVTWTGDSLSSRAYNLALAPQLIHTSSELLSQLVSSKAFRQVEFLAVGSFYIYQQATDSAPEPSLSRIPSTREDVFSNTSIPARAKRSLMKFLKFVLDYEAEPQVGIWKPRAEKPLTEFLSSEFRLDDSLQAYVVTLTLSSDGAISVEAGLRAIHKHMSSMGKFGPGFAAVYPKWGGLSEVAQVGCRAGAVGGAVYMLGTGIASVASRTEGLSITLTNDVVVDARSLVRESSPRISNGSQLSKLIAVIKSPLKPLFKIYVEGAPIPAVSVVAFPSESVLCDDEQTNEHPVYALVHSSDTGECPAGQSVVHLSTPASNQSKTVLHKALSSLLEALVPGEQIPAILYQLQYEHRSTDSSVDVDGGIISFAPLVMDLAFNDSIMNHVRTAWDVVMDGVEPVDGRAYMMFDDREGADAEEDIYE